MENNTYRALLRGGEAALESAGNADAPFDARCLLESAAGVDRTHLILMYDQPVPQAVRVRYQQWIGRRADGEPLQYILGAWDFCGNSFAVRPGVLIPRPETEFLVDKAVSLLPEGGVLFDVCAGTGCIGLSAALRRPDAQVYLFEKFEAPFSCMQENIRVHSAQNIHAVLCDVLQGAPQSLPRPDGIVSNPPYIRTAELAGLQSEVRREPREALDGGADGLLFYRALREKWFPLLRVGGFISMECGEDQPQAAASLFGRARVEPDYLGVPRFVTAIHE